jgi:Bacterial alpha-L-rhamnosidase 6 hairpin glycosidase domain/Bacterial alpha-L-rhamnosidase C-terminal domain
MGRLRSGRRWSASRFRLTVALALGLAALVGVTAPAASAQSGPAHAGTAAWQRYVVAPKSRDVKPVTVLSSTGDVTNPDGLLGHGVTTLTATAPPTWPTGTSATASSYHTPNDGDNGQPTTYVPDNAIDGNTETFWNDANPDTYPAWLQITSPSAVSLPGITVLSNSDGVPVDYTVATWNGTAWVTQATVTGNSAIEREVPFPATVSTTQVLITVTLDQSSPEGDFTRINEVYPGLVPPAPSVVVDFGKDIVGYPRLKLDGASANDPGLELAFSETQEYLTNESDFTRSDNGDTITPGTDQVAVPATPETWTDSYGCQDGTQVCDDGLHGFRYLRITLAALASDAPYTQDYGTVRISGVSLDFTAYLGTPSTYKGWFLSSDTALNKYWYGASYTNELVTATFTPDTTDPRDANSPSLDGKLVLLDGAKRDRDPYDGDIAVSGLTDYLTNDASIAARNVLADLANHQSADGWIPPASIDDYTLPLFDYPMWWVVDSWDYLLYTGDMGYATTYYPNLVKLLNSWYPSVTDSRGLLDKGMNGTSGWGDYAFLPRSGEVTYYNALYVWALKDAAAMATSLGDTAQAAAWTQRAQTVSDAINEYLWDPSVGAYLDSNTGPVSHPQDGNGIAIIAGVADQSRATSVLDYLSQTTETPYGNAFMDNDSLVSDGDQRVYAFTSFPEIEARFTTPGQSASALNEIDRLYGWMYTHDPGITDWEGISTGGTPYEGAYTSMAHGWSTGVVPELTNDLLGATPTGPGFSTWSVQPHPVSVTWAEGQLPTPHGPLDVSWRQGDGQFSLRVTAPRGTSGDIAVPVTDAHAQVIVDGRTVWSDGTGRAFGATLADGYVTLQAVGGGSPVSISVRD